MKILGNIDLCQNEILNAAIQKLATAPSNAVQGQIYFNTTDKLAYIYDGSNWIALSGGGAGGIPDHLTIDNITLYENIAIYSDGEELEGHLFNGDIDTFYYSQGIRIYDNDNDTDHYLYFPPDKTGTIALTDDIPTLTDRTSATNLSSSGTKGLTERAIYYGLPQINGSRSFASSSFYAPTSVGTSGYVLKSNGSGAPSWTDGWAASKVASKGYWYLDIGGNTFKIQWGYATPSSTGAITVTFSSAFNSACVYVGGTTRNSTSTTTLTNFKVTSFSNTGFTAYGTYKSSSAQGYCTDSYFWIAIGY